MTGSRMLDYALFEVLSQRVDESNTDSSTSFAETVLGYGFDSNSESYPPTFVILCKSADHKNLNTLLKAACPEHLFTYDGIDFSLHIQTNLENRNLQHAYCPESPTNQKSKTSISDILHLHLGQTLRQALLHENRKIIFPNYLLRYVPYTSPQLLILRIALGQIHYLHTTSDQQREEFEPRSVSANMREITRWSNMSRTTVYRLLHEDPRSDWLVDVNNRGSYQNQQGQHISLSNEYLLKPLKLTPGDGADLMCFLHARRKEGLLLDDTLAELTTIDRRDIFTFPYRLPAQDDFETPKTILQILEMVYGPINLTPQRLNAIEAVRTRLIGDDFVAASWYLIRKCLPVYGADIITLYLMSQPLIFHHGIIKRDTFWVDGGAETLMAWTGDRSLGKYFPKAHAKGRGRPPKSNNTQNANWHKSKREKLSDFFMRVDTRKKPSGKKTWKIEVKHQPMLSKDQHKIETTYQILSDCIAKKQLFALQSLLNQPIIISAIDNRKTILDGIYALSLSDKEREVLNSIAFQLFSNFETSDKPQISKFETPVDRLISLFETSVQQIISNHASPAIELFSIFETYLKILFVIKDSFELIKNTDNPQNSCLQNGETNMSDSWSLQKILIPADDQMRRMILNQQNRQLLFKAWLIYAALNPKIRQPFNFALSQMREPLQPADQASRRLAAAPFTQLLTCLQDLAANPEGVGYRDHVHETQKAIQEDLFLLTLGETPSSKQLLFKRLRDILL